jgi:hypothetical protein
VLGLVVVVGTSPGGMRSYTFELPTLDVYTLRQRGSFDTAGMTYRWLMRGY